MIQQFYFDPLKKVYIIVTFNDTDDIIDVHIYKDVNGRRLNYAYYASRQSCNSCNDYIP